MRSLERGAETEKKGRDCKSSREIRRSVNKKIRCVSDQIKFDLIRASLTVHPSKKMAIAVATGDENTGNPNATPMTKSPKGPNTIQAVAVNLMQASLFDDLVLPDQSGEDREERLTWLLLLSTQADKVRAELSLPVTCNGKVDGWKERIILGELNMDQAKNAKPMPLLPELPDIEVPLQRRTA